MTDKPYTTNPADKDWSLRGGTVMQARQSGKSQATIERLSSRIAELCDSRDHELYQKEEALEAMGRQISRAEKAEARIAELERALKPFADIAGLDISLSEDSLDFYRPMSAQNARAEVLKIGHFRDAYAATLKGKPDGQ